jgi:hypothetical protein
VKIASGGIVERGPHLVLHLLEDMAGTHDEDALAPPPADELAEDHADLERLAKADGAGENDAGPQVGRVEGATDGCVLVVEGIRQGLRRDDEAWVADRQGRLADSRLEPEAAAPVPESATTVICAGSTPVMVSSDS